MAKVERHELSSAYFPNYIFLLSTKGNWQKTKKMKPGEAGLIRSRTPFARSCFRI